MSKTKVNVAKNTMKDPELISMFNAMVGTSDPDPNIVIPKYENILENADHIIHILDSFMKSPCYHAFKDTFSKGFDEIKEFLDKSRAQLDELRLEKNDKILSGDELNELNSNPEKIQEYITNIGLRYKITQLGETYNKLKNSPVIKEFIMTAKNLKNAVMLEKKRTGNQKHDLEEKGTLLSNFILQSDGDFMVLFNFTTLDFKQMFLSDIMDQTFSKYTLLVLHLIYKKVIIIVKEITSPDIDVDKFSELLVNNIDEIRKHIPRCDKAFDKIKSSVGLLKSNFGEYYKDFISSQNPGIIVENFVVDVAANSTADMATTRQFREIIKFYRNNMQSKVKDPKIKKIFQMVGENLDILEEKTSSKDEEKE